MRRLRYGRAAVNQAGGIRRMPGLLAVLAGIVWITCSGMPEEARADIYAHQSRLTFEWAPASGQVDHYDVFVSVDEGPFPDVPAARVPASASPLRCVITAQDRSSHRIRVRAVSGEGVPGAYSEPSDRVFVFLDGSGQDTDGDGIPNLWESIFGLDPYDPADAALDADLDLLTNLEEFILGTHPLKPDSDRDGLLDGEEVRAGTNPNNPLDNLPLADAGPDRKRNRYQRIPLDGSGSWDPNGDPISCVWAQEEGPSGLLLDPYACSTEFLALAEGDYIFSLVVSDGKAESDPDEMSVRVVSGEHAPEAHAGRDLLASQRGPVVLDGSGSCDPNGAALSFLWRQVEGPSVQLQSPGSDAPSFLPVGPGTYTFELVVDNGLMESPPDAVSVEVVEAFQPGDVFPPDNPDGTVDIRDGFMIWLYFLGLAEPSAEEVISLDVAPIRVVEDDGSRTRVRLVPDGEFTATDVYVLQQLYNGTFLAAGWELSESGASR